MAVVAVQNDKLSDKIEICLKETSRAIQSQR